MLICPSLHVIADPPNETTFNNTHLSAEPTYETIHDHLEDSDDRIVINPIYDSKSSKLNVATKIEYNRVNKILHMQGGVSEKDTDEENCLLSQASRPRSTAYVNTHVTIATNPYTGYSTLIRPDKVTLSSSNIMVCMDPPSKSNKEDDKGSQELMVATGHTIKVLRSNSSDVSLSDLQQLTINVQSSTENLPRAEKNSEEPCSTASVFIEETSPASIDDPVNGYSTVRRYTPPSKAGLESGYKYSQIIVPDSH